MSAHCSSDDIARGSDSALSITVTAICEIMMTEPILVPASRAESTLSIDTASGNASHSESAAGSISTDSTGNGSGASSDESSQAQPAHQASTQASFTGITAQHDPPPLPLCRTANATTAEASGGALMITSVFSSSSDTASSSVNVPPVPPAAFSLAFAGIDIGGGGGGAALHQASTVGSDSTGGLLSSSTGCSVTAKNAAELRDLISMKTKHPSNIKTLGWFFSILQICLLLPEHSIFANSKCLLFLGLDAHVANLIPCVIGWMIAGTAAGVMAIAPFFNSPSFQTYFVIVGISVADLAFLFIGSVIVLYFIWPMRYESSNPLYDPHHILPASHVRLLRTESNPEPFQRHEDFFAEVLRNSEIELVESISNYIVVFVALISVPGSVLLSIAFFFLGRHYFPWNFLDLGISGLLAVVLWSGSLFVAFMFFASCLGVVLLTVWLLRDRLNRYAVWSAHCLNLRIARILRVDDTAAGMAAPFCRPAAFSPASISLGNSSSGGDIGLVVCTNPNDGLVMELESSFSLDIVIRERYLVSSLIERLSLLFSRPVIMIVSLIVLVLMTMGISIRMVGLNAFNLTGCIFVYLGLFVVFFTLAVIQTGDYNFFEVLLDLRSRIPVAFANERHGHAFRELRLELDSIISHCQNTPIGFRFFGILITPNLVAGVLYSTLLALASLAISQVAK
jgi:hypothetical protein